MDRLSATRSEGVGLIVRAISFRDFQTMWSQITNVTDRQTDRRPTCDPKTAHMHLSALRGKKCWPSVTPTVVYLNFSHLGRPDDVIQRRLRIGFSHVYLGFPDSQSRNTGDFWTRKRVPNGHERCSCCCSCSTSWGYYCYQIFLSLRLCRWCIISPFYHFCCFRCVSQYKSLLTRG